jgi:hypothetical protein
MPFITAAHDFLEDPGELSQDKDLDLMNDTVSYLLGNAVGFGNAKSTDMIVKILNENGYDINRHYWEINALGKLRENGVFIAANRTKGMFIIESEEEAEKFYFQYAKRVATEKARLGWLRTLIDSAHWVKSHNKPKRKGGKTKK